MRQSVGAQRRLQTVQSRRPAARQHQQPQRPETALQRQRAILYQRLKVPPSINQFSLALDKNGATEVFKLLAKYRPETAAQKKERLTAAAASKEAGKTEQGKKPYGAKYGLNHVTALVEAKKAKLVVIASDVDPVELVLWLPALCRKMDVPYCIVKNKARLGSVVHKKTAAAIAITDVRQEDRPQLQRVCESVKGQFNDSLDARRRWGGGIMGGKSQARQALLEKAKAKEARV